MTESFAVRALLGSLAAAALAAVLIGFGLVRTARARRLVLLTPVLTAAVAAIASIGEAYLPKLLWVSEGATSPAGTLLELLGESGGVVAERSLDVLGAAYAVVVLALVLRRAAGVLSVRRLLSGAVTLHDDSPVLRVCRELAASMGVRVPRMALLPDCPGGAFTTGTIRPVIAVDPKLLDELDAHELQGLLAHELAHMVRRDTVLGTVVGLFRDLAFFLPPLHLANRWLCREQEESADELASQHTGRPAALASSILKVWDSSRGRRALRHACAAVPARATVPSGVLMPWSSGQAAIRILTARIERLIAVVPTPSRLRRHAEVLLAAAALATGTAAAVGVPAWIAAGVNIESLNGYLASSSPPHPVEAPAFATFRASTPTTAAPAAADTDTGLPWSTPAIGACACVESRAQLRAVAPATAVDETHRLAWRTEERPSWELSERFAEASGREARAVWTINDNGPQMGVFVVSRPLD